MGSFIACMFCFLSMFDGDASIAVTGKVISRQTREPIFGVRITSTTGNVAQTDDLGRFTITVESVEILELTFSCFGFADHVERLDFASGVMRTIAVEMEKIPTFKEEMLVGGAPIPEVEPAHFVTPDYVVHAPGAFEDTLQSLKVMPGVVGGDDYSARLYVRGGRSDQNGIFLDNIPIYDPYRLFGLTSLFNPETIRNVKLIPGGFDVRYGDRLSSIIEVGNRQGDVSKGVSGSANISLTNANFVGEGRLSSKVPSSWLVSARRTYYDLVIEAVDDEASSYPSFMDLQALLYVQPNPRHEWFITLMACDESTDMSEEEEETFQGADPDFIDIVDDQKNQIAGLNGSHLITDAIRWSYTLSYTRNTQTSDMLFTEGETAYDTNFDQDLTSDNSRLSSMIEWYSDRHSWIGGLEYTHSDNTVAFNLATEDPRIIIPDDLHHFEQSQDYEKLGYFLQDTWEVVPDLEWKVGIRWDKWTLSGMNQWSPRTSIRWEATDRWIFRAAWGDYAQFPSYEMLQGDGSFLDLRGIKDLELKPERAVHTLLGGEYESPKGWNLSLDIYDKKLEDLIASGEELETILVLDAADQAQPYTRDTLTMDPENSRRGFARGVDLTFKLHDQPGRPMYGMISYTFGQAKSRCTGEPYQWESWDRRHHLTWIAGWNLTKHWELGWKWRIGTGFPYTPVTHIIRVVDDIDGDGIYEPEADETFTYQRDEPDSVIRSERYPVYHRLDFRVQYTRQMRRLGMTFYLDVINAYAQKNIQYYEYNADYSERREQEGMPIVPSFGAKLKF